MAKHLVNITQDRSFHSSGDLPAHPHSGMNTIHLKINSEKNWMTSNAPARFLARCPLSPANEPPFGLVTHGFVWAEPSDALSALMVLGGQECACWKTNIIIVLTRQDLMPRFGRVREHHIPFTGDKTVALVGNSVVLYSKMQLCL